MNRTPQRIAVSPRESSRILGRLFFSVALCLATIYWCAPASAQVPTQASVQTLNLLSGTVAKIQPDGSLVISAGSGTTPLLTTEVLPLSDTRRSRNRKSAPFTAVVVEGAKGGQRGFSAHCDDDGDGAVDEDPLDGIDNDGDGLIDEDFAAISDAMVVVHQDIHNTGGRAAHLEYYHWAYPHLRSTVFLSAAGSPGLSNGGTYRVVLGSQKWHEVTTISNRHSLAGQPETLQTTAFVAQPRRLDRSGASGKLTSCDPEAKLWVGVVVLEQKPDTRPVLDGGVLKLPLGEEPLPVAICVAESWLQLNHMLNESARVWAGVTDQITGRHASWIAPPLCAQCRLAPAPDFSWATNADGDVLVTANIVSGGNGGLDPDLFTVAGVYLGAPLEIRWLPDNGQAKSVVWLCMNEALLTRPHDLLSNPFANLPGLLDHQSAGRLQFLYSAAQTTVLAGRRQISGSYLSGRPFVADLAAASKGVAPKISLEALFVDQAEGAELVANTGSQVKILKSGEFKPKLSPSLLKGFPNPFRDVIQLRFAVPVTMGEAFAWDKGEDPPVGLDLAAAVPWQGGSPNVSVKVYSINGQELVTLFSGSLGPGENTVQWAGVDNYGRQVASGTYFCKLQMDNWSVTRRLVYLR